MQVLLKVDWFGPNAVLYTVDKNPHEDIPDDFLDRLPPGASWRENDKDDWTKVELKEDPAPAGTPAAAETSKADATPAAKDKTDDKDTVKK